MSELPITLLPEHQAILDAVTAKALTAGNEAARLQQAAEQATNVASGLAVEAFATAKVLLQLNGQNPEHFDFRFDDATQSLKFTLKASPPPSAT